MPTAQKKSFGTKILFKNKRNKTCARLVFCHLIYMENKIKKGHLYFHVANGRVERIVEVKNEKVEHRHHNIASVSLVTDFRLANRIEVFAYLSK